MYVKLRGKASSCIKYPKVKVDYNVNFVAKGHVFYDDQAFTKSVKKKCLKMLLNVDISVKCI